MLSRYNVVKRLTGLSFLYTSDDVHLITVGYYNEECPSLTSGKLANRAGPGLKAGIGSKSLCFLLTKDQTTSPFSASFQKIHEMKCLCWAKVLDMYYLIKNTNVVTSEPLSLVTQTLSDHVH